jgi:hypothetical protein
MVSATSLDTGKLINVETLTKYCKGCGNLKDEEKLKQHKNCDACPINYCGVSGRMEASGIVPTFARSVENCGVKYTQYVGGGNNKDLMSLVESTPYGGTETQ